MKRYAVFAASLGLALSLAQTALAQPAEDGPRPPRGERPERPGEGPGLPRLNLPPNLLLMALDTDHDGELSEAEINNAPTALRKLDKNADGKLTRDELRPPRDAQGRTFGGPEDRPQRGTPELFSQRLLSLDKDGDGKVSKEEAPERMRDNFDRIDTNRDGFIDKAEIEAMANRVRPGGPPAGRPNSPEQPREQN